uniref:G-protein coupled receptors family 1 profile domain-containing protein n=1 Tax=Branchiostoma floridae TaxID=7739 RepID=C3ZEF5_BRAFL|eukprot:XP_002593100.1 hypothetical protein BRAFLDRAFT_210025 [Branchiostoma floridae]
MNPTSTTVLVFVYISQLVAIVGFLANLLVLYIIIRYPDMRTVPNVFVLNLALADASYCLSITFDTVAQIHDSGWIFGRDMCVAGYVMSYGSSHCSVFFLTAISFERYKAITDPIAQQGVCMKKAWITCAAVWCAAALSVTPIFVDPNFFVYVIENHSTGGNITRSSCKFLHPPAVSTTLYGKLRVVYNFAVTYAFPTCIMINLYSVIWRKLRQTPPSTQCKQATESRNKVTKMVVAVVSFFVVALSLWQINTLLLEFKLVTHIPDALFELGLLLYVTNSAINPVFYALLGERFGSYARKTMCCWRVGRKDGRSAQNV